MRDVRSFIFKFALKKMELFLAILDIILSILLRFVYDALSGTANMILYLLVSNPTQPLINSNLTELDMAVQRSDSLLKCLLLNQKDSKEFKRSLKYATPQVQKMGKEIAEKVKSDGEKNLVWIRQLDMDSKNVYKKIKACFLSELLAGDRNILKRIALKPLAARKATALLNSLLSVKKQMWMSTMKENETRRKSGLPAVNDPYLPATGPFADCFWVAPPAWVLNSCRLQCVDA